MVLRAYYILLYTLSYHVEYTLHRNTLLSSEKVSARNSMPSHLGRIQTEVVDYPRKSSQ